MDIHKLSKEIIEKHIKLGDKTLYASGHLLKEIIKKHVVMKKQRVCVFGYKKDVDRFMEYMPEEREFTMCEYANIPDWRWDPGHEFFGEEQIDKIAGLQIDKLVIVSEDLRYLLQMYLLNQGVPYEIVDIYELIKKEYGKIILKGIANTPKFILREHMHRLGTYLSDQIGALKRLKCIKYWRSRIRRQYDNYDAILVKRYYFQNKTDKEEKKYYLKELIINYLFIKDFENAFFYIDEYTRLFGAEANFFLPVKKEFEELFTQIKKILHGRKEKDIIVFWCDALPYEDFKAWHFLEKEAEDSLLFENAYAHVPYTHTTLQAMFTGSPFFEGKMYMALESPNMITNGKTIDLLRNNNYQICESPDMYIQERLTRYLKYTVKTSRHPAPLCLWEMLAQILEKQEQKHFILCHMDCELHSPYWNGHSKKMRMGKEAFLTDDIATFAMQRKESANYLEEKILWYSSFLGKNTSKIYMSDHGLGEPAYVERRLHSFCFVKDSNIKKGSYNDYFSYLDFYDLLAYMIQPKEENFKKMFSNYVLIQNDYPYSKGYCEKIRRRMENDGNFTYDEWMAFRGVIKDGYKLILFPTHKELWLDMDDNKVDSMDIEDQELVHFMRDAVGNVFADIYTGEHYMETKKLCENCEIDLNNI